MKKISNRGVLLLAAAGSVSGIATSALAQPFVINASGATLLENFLNAPASTNDYADVDRNGVGRRFNTNQQLAPFGINPFPADQYWIVQYRAVGSVNGFQELVDFGSTFVQTADNVDIRSSVSNPSYFNRERFVVNGVRFPAAPNPSLFNSGNPGGAPVRSRTDGSYVAIYSVPNNPPADPNTGIQIDVAPVDVPSSWSVFTLGDPAFSDTPGAPGYGRNPRRSVNNQGGSAGANLDNFLANLGPRNLFDPANPGAQDENTIFDTTIAFAPVATMVNFGAGLREVNISDLRHLQLTGRRLNGENLHVITRDSGSGTRNAWNNPVGVDPSWGVGENVGPLSTLAALNLPGPQFVPSNKSSTGGVENSVINSRLGLGPSGAERGVVAGWLTNGAAEVLGVRDDDRGGTDFVRPTISAILNNGLRSQIDPSTGVNYPVDGWTIGGPAIFASIGDPRSGLIPPGETLPNVGSDPGNTNRLMRNRHAAAYLNNITRSIEDYISISPPPPTSNFTPGELLANRFTLVVAQDWIQNPANPRQFVLNPDRNQNVQDFNVSDPANVLGNSAYAAFGNASPTRAGRVPTRSTGTNYSDGVTGGDTWYFNQEIPPARANYGTALAIRNRIAGDFNGDDARTLADVPDMIAAWNQRNGGPRWQPPVGTIPGATANSAIIEVLGDFNNDGNFGRRFDTTTSTFVADREDIRYFADGLAIVNGRLDRKAGFIAVDNAFGGNFFGVTLATGQTPAAGAARGDVFGAANVQTTRGYRPNAADGIVGNADLEYVIAQFCGNAFVTDGAANWADQNEAVGFDLSADMNGDLIVNWADVDEIFSILQTCPADFNIDGAVDINDFFAYLSAFSQNSCRADANRDGAVDINDFFAFLSAYSLGC